MLWILFWNRRVTELSTTRAVKKPQKFLIDHLLRIRRSRYLHSEQSEIYSIFILFYLTFVMCLGQGEATAMQANEIQQYRSSVSNKIPPGQYARTKVSLTSAEDSMIKQACTFCRFLQLLQHSQLANREKKTQNFKDVSPANQGRKMKYIRKRKTNENSQNPFFQVYSNDAAKRTKVAVDQNVKLIENSQGKPRERRSIGDRRLTRMYCRTGYILRIHANGHVDGTYESNSELGLMEIQTVGKEGSVRIRSQATGLYLAMTRSGVMYGTAVYNPARSRFVERIVEGWYNTYFVWRAPGTRRRKSLYVGLSKNGKAKKGNKISKSSKCAHFLPLRAKV